MIREGRNQWRLRLLAEADLLISCAKLLAPPDAGTLEDLECLASEGHELCLRAGLQVYLPFAELAAAASARGPTGLQEDHVCLFEGGQLCPCNETAYVRRDKGAILADIAGFYRAFGCTTRAASGEKHDHVVAELEFLALLLVMQAEAPDAEKEEVAGSAAQAFASDHLAAFLPAFCANLTGTGGEFHATLAGLLLRLWTEFALRRGLPEPGPIQVPDLDPDPGATTFECGPCTGNPKAPPSALSQETRGQ